MNPTAVACPNCQAKPGQPCTQPTDTGRKAVSWVHLAREDAAREAWEADRRAPGGDLWPSDRDPISGKWFRP